jgi:peptidoglycan hydrolase-like protein with peptidoglycan-binding domain
VGRTAASCCGHREYALPSGRKTDPNFEMDGFRQHVAAILSGTLPPPVLIPAAETGGLSRATLRRGDTGPLVTELQQRLGMPESQPTFGPKTEAAVREFQRQRGMVPDGIVGPKTWQALDVQRIT